MSNNNPATEISSRIKQGGVGRYDVLKVEAGGQKYAVLSGYMSNSVMPGSGVPVTEIDSGKVDSLKLPAKGEAVSVVSRTAHAGGMGAMEQKFTTATVIGLNDLAAIVDRRPPYDSLSRHVLQTALKAG